MSRRLGSQTSFVERAKGFRFRKFRALYNAETGSL